ncbi:MAG: Gfo/Idh/MocA family oxidoreductase [Candidatus Eremiobacteraeota bacterium]|nr:Gfo/Idh/MocA family oxidoreductase [Candidatus Eremiobacteraeota bacterium]
MLRAAIIGLGKMGLSHQSMINVHPELRLVSVCDSSGYVLDVLAKYTGVKTYTDYKRMLAEEQLDCVFIATPSRYHAEIVNAALERNLHIFCEKPFALDPEIGYRLAESAESRKLVNQVGYHYRFVATFNETKRLLERNVIGELHHVRAEAYGPVVLRPKGATWRSQKSEGGGCLFDYSCHAIDLLNYLVGRPVAVSGTVLNSVFSSDVDDEIYSTFQFAKGLNGQLATNWSDESFRKMSLKISFWGTNGRINVDRQELQVYVRSLHSVETGFETGWNVRYTTELTKPVWFYVRGEEYSAQIDHFVKCMKNGSVALSSFRSASDTSLVARAMRADADKTRTLVALDVEHSGQTSPESPALQPARSFVRSLLDRMRTGS